jgi:hypothetical protein
MVEVPNPETAVRTAISHWSRLSDLAEFAVRQHGFGDTDGGFGATYSCDLDEHDRSSGRSIPEGKVAVYGFWGPPEGYELLVDEAVYLTVLTMVLTEHGLLVEAAQVQSLLK